MKRYIINLVFLCLIITSIFYKIPIESNSYNEKTVFEKKWSFNTNDSIDSSSLLFDLELDGKNEILFGSNDKLFYCLDYNGSLKWSYETKGPIQSSPAIADFNRDNLFEVVFGSNDGFIYCLDNNVQDLLF